MATTTDPGGDPYGNAATRPRLWPLLRHPRAGWAAIDNAPTTAGALAAMAAALAAIGPVAGLVHDMAFGRESMGIIQYRPTPTGAVVTALAGWVFSLVAALLLALAVDALAGWFGGTRNRVGALKVVCYGATPFWLAQLFGVFPATSWLQLLGLYSVPLLLAGAPRLTHVRQERALTVGASAAGLGLVLALASLVATGAVARRWVEPTVRTAQGRQVVRGVPGLAADRLTAPANDKKHAVAPGIAAASVAGNGTVAASSLQSLLPERIGAFGRTAVESQSSTLAGVATANAKGTYVAGTNSFTLAITDAGQPGALATSNSVIAGEVNRVTDTGYQRSRVVNGVRVTEKWDNADHGGSYGRTVAGRFTVEAQGTAPSIDTLRAAVASVDQTRLAALAR